jgi:hypothetical protein
MAEVSIAEEGIAEVGMTEIGTHKVDSTGDGIAAVDMVVADTAEVDTDDVFNADDGTAEVGAAEVGTAEIGTAEVRSYVWILPSPHIPLQHTLFKNVDMLLVCHCMYPLSDILLFPHGTIMNVVLTAHSTYSLHPLAGMARYENTYPRSN